MHQGHFASIAPQECLALLRERSVGRVAWSDRGQVSVVPVTYVVSDDLVVFKTSKQSVLGKLTGTVAFQTDDIDEESESGWSVLAQGHIAPHADQTSMPGLAPWAPGERNLVMAITVEHVTGRAVSLGTEGDADVYA